MPAYLLPMKEICRCRHWPTVLSLTNFSLRYNLHLFCCSLNLLIYVLPPMAKENSSSSSSMKDFQIFLNCYNAYTPNPPPLLNLLFFKLNVVLRTTFPQPFLLTAQIDGNQGNCLHIKMKKKTQWNEELGEYHGTWKHHVPESYLDFSELNNKKTTHK